jgi:nucleotide-binding universal stress UspA family protein
VEDESRRQQQLLERRAESLEAALGTKPRIRLGTGEPAEVLLETAQHEPSPEATLVAVGSRGLGPLGRMRFGSVSTRLVRAAEGSILIHPSEEDPEPRE